MTDTLRLRGLSFGYPDRGIFHDVDLTLPPGGFTVLIGPNGGGKTTLLKLALGLLKPDGGVIEVLGAPPASGRPVGYVPQDVTATDDLPLSLFAVTLMGRLTPRTRFWTKADRQVALACLEDMGLAEFRNKPFRELSIGQRQRGLIARALAGEPKVLFLDEPLSSVDPKAREQIVDCLKKAHQKASVVMVSHDLTVIPDCATALVMVNNGVTLWQGRDINRALMEDLHRRTCRFCDDVISGEGRHVE